MAKRKLEYSSNIKDMPFLFQEMRKAAQILGGGETQEMITKRSVEDNLFQLDKEKRRREMAAKIRLRLGAISLVQRKLLATGNDDDTKLVAFYAMIKTDLLLFEFMRDVYRDKYALRQNVITDGDIVTFLTTKASESEKVASWTANNLVRVKNIYKSILCEAGLAKRRGSDLLITKPVIGATSRGCWEQNDIYAETMLLED